MIPNEIGLQLHDRATRGEELSAKERTQLEIWYSAQDVAEQKYLGMESNADSVTTLRADIEAALSRLETLTSQVHVTSNENERLRSEIQILRRQVAMQLETA